MLCCFGVCPHMPDMLSMASSTQAPELHPWLTCKIQLQRGILTSLAVLATSAGGRSEPLEDSGHLV